MQDLTLTTGVRAREKACAYSFASAEEVKPYVFVPPPMERMTLHPR